MASLNPDPRDRLLSLGPGALSDAELLTVLLRRARRQQPSPEKLLASAGGLPGLLKADRQALEHHGVSTASAAVLLAASELLCRALRPEKRTRVLDKPEATVAYLRARYAIFDQQVMGAIFLDLKHRLLAEQELFRGAMDRNVVESRQILRLALAHCAAGVIVWRIHPSGDPTPTDDDRIFALRLKDAGATFGVRLLDHLILGASGRFVSLKRRLGARFERW